MSIEEGTELTAEELSSLWFNTDFATMIKAFFEENPELSKSFISESYLMKNLYELAS
jgi:hypothetical protein